MTLVLGSLLGAGLLLLASPFLWPARKLGLAIRLDVWAKLRARLAQAGLGALPVPAFVAISVVLGLACAALAQALLGVQPITVVAGGVALVLPSLISGSEPGRSRCD